ncbi:hypothetical protein DPX16_20866 [Anabarilius grahami]|uniref:Uncharacterized protein n=1 Tax=Anabarilius grahami TaxID=495550 RepID=A0A3N0Z410_ANAGA|nr:hypothetical protein DPX16_20866 [Anabarilius grahami]
MWSSPQRTVQTNRDRTREEIMFMDAIVNVTVVRSRAGASVVGAERGRWSDCATHASRAAGLLLCHSHRRHFRYSSHEYEMLTPTFTSILPTTTRMVPVHTSGGSATPLPSASGRKRKVCNPQDVSYAKER